MRADRLVAVLLMLQARQLVTAADVATELEVSVRTARRDLEALGMAGLPVYSSKGRGGGWRLLGGGKTDLSALTAAEVRALFLTTAQPTAGAATSAVMKAALRKLVRALPEPMRAGAEAAGASIVVDEAGWDRRFTDPAMSAVPALLDEVQRVVLDGRQADLTYVARDGAETVRRIHPLGIAAKGRTWYLIAQTGNGQRTFRIDRIVAVAPTDAPVVRPAGFVLADAWASIVSDVNDRRLPITATLHVSVDSIRLLRGLLGSRLTLGGPVDSPHIRHAVAGELRAPSTRAIAGELAGMGDMVFVTGPADVVGEMAMCTAALAAMYLR